MWLLVSLPVFLYALMAVPRYTARGAVQVGGTAGINGGPLAEMLGTGSQTEVQTEVEIMRRREFLADVLTRLNLQIRDPNRDLYLTTDIEVASGAVSPVDVRVPLVRAAATIAKAAPNEIQAVPIVLQAPSTDTLSVLVSGDSEPSEAFRIGERFEHPRVLLQFSTQPLEPGDSIELNVLPEGLLLEALQPHIEVAALGTVRTPTSIVEISVDSADRTVARNIVAMMMQRYVEKNLEWQSKSASQASSFIKFQLDEVGESLVNSESRLRDFSEENNAISSRPRSGSQSRLRPNSRPNNSR